MPDECLFCRIGSGAIPTAFVAESAEAVAFRDIKPVAPVHVLVIPRSHVTSLALVDDEALLGKLLRLAAEVARHTGVADSGYRTVINTNDDGGQTIGHLHVHVIGGRQMNWPPG